MLWISSLNTLSSESNKLYNLPAICKHFVHVLQLLMWHGNISDPTLSLKKGVKTCNTLLFLSMHTLQSSSFRKNQPEVFSASFFSLCQKTKSVCRFFPFGEYLYLLLLPNAFYFSHGIFVSFPSEDIVRPCSNSSYILGRRKQSPPTLN